MEENKVNPHSAYYDRKTGEAVTFVRSDYPGAPGVTYYRRSGTPGILSESEILTRYIAAPVYGSRWRHDGYDDVFTVIGSDFSGLGKHPTRIRVRGPLGFESNHPITEFARYFRPARNAFEASFTFDLKPESYRALERFAAAVAFPPYMLYGKIDTRTPNDDRAALEVAIDAFVDRDEGEAAALAVKICKCAETYAAHFPASMTNRTAKIDRLIAAVDVYDTQDTDQLSNARPVIEAIDALTRA